jgi:peroxiredoxin
MLKRLSLPLLAVVIALAGLASGYAVYERIGPPPAAEAFFAPPAEAGLPEQRPEFTLADLDGQQRSVGEWDDHVLLINFWATWCPPCQREIPALMALQEEYGARGFQVVGIAIDDPERVREYADEMDINYPLLVGESAAIRVSQAYGNRIGALPYTVVTDRAGRIVYAHRGEVEHAEAEAVIKPLLEGM